MLPVSRAARTVRLPDRLRPSRRRTKQRVCRQSDPGTIPVDQVSVSDPYSESFTDHTLSCLGEVCLEALNRSFREED